METAEIFVIRKPPGYQSYLKRILAVTWHFILCVPLVFLFFPSASLLWKLLFSLGIILIGYIQGYKTSRYFIECIKITKDTISITYRKLFKRKTFSGVRSSLDHHAMRYGVSVQYFQPTAYVIQSSDLFIEQFSAYGWTQNDFDQLEQQLKA